MNETTIAGVNFSAQQYIITTVTTLQLLACKQRLAMLTETIVTG